MSFLRGQDAWRKHPVFTWKWADAFPGFKEGAIAFGIFSAAEFGLEKMKASKGHGHGHGHGKEVEAAVNKAAKGHH